MRLWHLELSSEMWVIIVTRSQRNLTIYASQTKLILSALYWIWWNNIFELRLSRWKILCASTFTSTFTFTSFQILTSSHLSLIPPSLFSILSLSYLFLSFPFFSADFHLRLYFTLLLLGTRESRMVHRLHALPGELHPPLPSLSSSFMSPPITFLSPPLTLRPPLVFSLLYHHPIPFSSMCPSLLFSYPLISSLRLSPSSSSALSPHLTFSPMLHVFSYNLMSSLCGAASVTLISSSSMLLPSLI